MGGSSAGSAAASARFHKPAGLAWGKDGRTLWKHIEQMGKLGLRIEECDSGKQPVPPCRF